MRWKRGEQCPTGAYVETLAGKHEDVRVRDIGDGQRQVVLTSLCDM